MSGLGRALDPLKRRVMLMVGRAVVEYINDATKMQSAQVSLLEGEVREKVEHFQQYGFTSVTEPGAEGVALSVSGNRDHVILIAVDDRRYRKANLLPGEVAVYSKWGDYILLKEGEIEVVHATKVKITCPLVTMSGDLEVDGNITSGQNITADGEVRDAAGTKSMSGMRNTYNTHTHPETGVTTNQPNQAM